MIPSRQLNSVKLVGVVKNFSELWLVVDQQKAWKKRKKKGGGEGPESPHFIDGGHFDPLVDQARSH